MSETPQPSLDNLDVPVERVPYSRSDFFYGTRRIPGATDVSEDPATLAREAAHKYYADEFHLTGPIRLTEAEKRRIHNGAAAARLALRAAEQSEGK